MLIRASTKRLIAVAGGAIGVGGGDRHVDLALCGRERHRGRSAAGDRAWRAAGESHRALADAFAGTSPPRLPVPSAQVSPGDASVATAPLLASLTRHRVHVHRHEAVAVAAVGLDQYVEGVGSPPG